MLDFSIIKDFGTSPEQDVKRYPSDVRLDNRKVFRESNIRRRTKYFERLFLSFNKQYMSVCTFFFNLESLLGRTKVLFFKEK